MALEMMQVERREKVGTNSSRKLRSEGKIPAVLYGQGKDAESLALPALPFRIAVAKHVRVLQLSLGKEKVQALVKEVQFDHLGEEIVHVDFLRVKEGQKVRVKVRIDFQGHPKGVTAGGEFVHTISDLEVDCEVMHIPESIPVKVDHLEIDQSVTVGELAIPQGVTTPLGKDAIVCTVVQKALEPEPTADAAAAAGPTEPELIGKKKEEGADEEGAEGAAPKAAAKEEKPAKKEEKK